MSDLILPLKSEYWWQIKNETKGYEYRLNTPYWQKRLIGRNYDRVIFMLGYPRRDEHDKRLVRPYQGYVMQTIKHPHFGPNPVEVFAIYAQG